MVSLRLQEAALQEQRALSSTYPISILIQMRGHITHISKQNAGIGCNLVCGTCAVKRSDSHLACVAAFLSSPVIVDGVIYVGSTDGDLYALD